MDSSTPNAPDVTFRLFNTLTRQKENFSPLEEGHVKMYTCGPTVYNFAHIGNFRTYIFEDILRRSLKFFGYKVTQVMNLTDIDDKTIVGAINAKVSVLDFTETYKKAFFEDLSTLKIEKAEHYPAATDFIPQMIEFIQILLDKGIAYQSKDRSIYYSISKFKHYGCLSHLKLDELKVGASERVINDEYDKDNASDFVLWKAYDPERDGEIYWESPFGKGRPGWHLECSTMAMCLLGDTLDIHAGGVDNIFPHHENEIAQSEGLSGKQFVKYWMHSEHLVVNHKKMSKSLGNFFTLRDLLNKGYTGVQVRFMLLNSHYKTPLNFTFEGLDGSKSTLQRINDFIQRLQEISLDSPYLNDIVVLAVEKAKNSFAEGLADDLNISKAIAALFELIHEINVFIDHKELSSKDAKIVLNYLETMDQVLGVMEFKQKDDVPEELHQLLAKRNQMRAEKNWPESDRLRKDIEERGYVIEDTASGARLKKKV